jgi:predicted Zn-ribbon and HTH transcriptional regulator
VSELAVKCRDCTKTFWSKSVREVLQKRCPMCERARIAEAWKNLNIKELVKDEKSE